MGECLAAYNKRVLLVIGQLPPPVHGSTVMTELFIAALKRNGFWAVLVEKRFSETLEDVEVPSIGKVFKIPKLIFSLFSAIRLNKPELCIFFISVGWTSFLVDSLLALILKIHKVPYILYFHGAGYSRYEQSVSSMKYVVRSVLGGALGGIVLGQRLKTDVNHCIPDGRLYVLPNGVPDTNSFNTVEARCESGPITILFLSNLVDYKGPMEFLHMAKIVARQQPKVRFIMAGRPSSSRYFESLKAWINENGLDRHISFTGGVHGKRKEELFRSSHIFVVPTLKDTFGLVNVEAMQWSLPVITSNIGSIPDVVRDGVSGFIIDPRNTEQCAGKVLQLVNDSEMRAKMGAAGRRAYERHYSLDAYFQNVNETLEFFLNLNRPM